MASSGFSSGFQAEPSWGFPEDLPSPGVGAFPEDRSSQPSSSTRTGFPEPPKTEQPKPQKRKHYAPRQCRICLETVLPTTRMPSEGVLGSFQEPEVVYESEEGRLIRPCKCKGSSKYVHEACLQGWRHADPAYGRRNYWQCPTCGFRYRLERMRWGRWISSTFLQVALTIFILLCVNFLLGFVADPIINLYLDPYSTITSNLPVVGGDGYEGHPFDDEVTTWTEHFLKGLAATGLLGFVKVFFTLSPWQWWNIRSSGIMAGGNGGRAGNTGRDRVANISWVVVVVGVFTFLLAVWKVVRAWSRRTLEKAGERVMDVQGDDDDDDDEEDEGPTQDTAGTSRNTSSQ